MGDFLPTTDLILPSINLKSIISIAMGIPFNLPVLESIIYSCLNQYDLYKVPPLNEKNKIRFRSPC